jgi:CDP-diacylglycerol--serine O-phosphatidyltransferase
MGKLPPERIAEIRDDLPFGKFLPNGLTLLGLCSGATAIRFALSGNWKAAVIAIVVAAILDMLDGRLARWFGVDSKFGAQLDSLADLVSFGIAPSMIVYMWTLYHAQGAGWALSLVFCVCCAIRLARFNIESEIVPNEDDEDDDADVPEPNAHFTGVPTPAAACLVMLPMLLSFQFSEAIFRNPMVTAGMVAIVSVLMVSRLKTVSLKKLNIPRPMKAPLFAFAGLLVAAVIFWPWATLTTGLIVYLATLPFGAVPMDELRRRRFRLRLRRRPRA